jgi:hypothetical protein
MSAKRKQGAVLRLLKGEPIELVSRELGVTAAELSAWRDAFLAAGEASLKTRPAPSCATITAASTSLTISRPRSPSSASKAHPRSFASPRATAAPSASSAS